MGFCLKVHKGNIVILIDKEYPFVTKCYDGLSTLFRQLF